MREISRKIQTNRQLNMCHQEIRDKTVERDQGQSGQKGYCYKIMFIGELAQLPEKKGGKGPSGLGEL